MSLLKPFEIAKILRCSTPAVRRLIASGKLPTVRIGQRHRVDAANLVRFLSGEFDHASIHNSSK